MTQLLAFLGLGVMGGPMTANLARGGYQIKAWNRTQNRPGVAMAEMAGATIVSTIADAVSDAEIIFTCLGDVPDVEAVILGDQGVVSFAQPGTLIVDMSTIGPNAARHLGAELHKKNLRFLDAPISGGDIGAQQGTLAIMVGGDAVDFAQCQPYFQVMGKTIKLCGPVGSGQAVKLCNQVLASLHIVAVCEALQLAEKQQIDPQLVVDVCSTGAAGSWILNHLGPKVIASDFAPGFMIKHILKDLRLVQESLGDQNLPGVELADRLFKIVQALEQGSEQGTQAMIRAYRETANF